MSPLPNIAGVANNETIKPSNNAPPLYSAISST